MRPLRRVFLAISCLLGATAASADKLVLTPTGMEKIEEIERAIAPAPLLTDAAGKPYIRCIIVDAVPGDPSVPWTEPEGKPTYVLFAFGEEGRDVGPRVQLSRHLVRFPGGGWNGANANAVDSLLDLRTLCSNRDRLWRTPIGSRRYVAGIFRALDPDGALGLRLDLELPLDGDDLEEGGLVLALKKRPPGPGEPGHETYRIDWERNVLLPARRRRAAKRLPELTNALNFFHAPDLPLFVRPIAQARKYSIYDDGFEEAAIRLLVARTELARIDPERVPAARKKYAEWLRWEGARVIDELVDYVSGATPGYAAPGEPGSYQSRLPQSALPVDPSDLADVAMDVLRASDAVFFSSPRPRPSPVPTLGGFPRPEPIAIPYGTHLVQELTKFGRELEGADPREEDEIDPRPKGKQLLLYLMGPPPSRDPQVQAARQRSAAIFKQVVQDQVFSGGSNSERNPGIRRFCFDALALSGWVASKKTLEATQSACSSSAFATAETISRMDESTTPVQRADAYARLKDRVQLMWDLAALTAVGREDERKIGQVVLDDLERLRSSKTVWHRPRTVILDAWRQLAEE